MLLAKLATSGLLKKGILKYWKTEISANGMIVDMAMWLKFGNFSIYTRE